MPSPAKPRVPAKLAKALALPRVVACPCCADLADDEVVVVCAITGAAAYVAGTEQAWRHFKKTGRARRGA